MYSLPAGALVGEEGDGVRSVGKADVGYGSLLNLVGTLGFLTETERLCHIPELFSLISG